MKEELINEESKTKGESIVIADECGDSMWDAVLEQEVEACKVNDISRNAASLHNKINDVQK